MAAELKLLEHNPHAEDVDHFLSETLGPISRIILKRGVSWGEFEEAAKMAFVDQAGEHFQIEGRKMTDSRISVITGLTRRDVKRLRELNESGTRSDKTYNANRATRVLSGWCQDQDYLDSNGSPRPLKVDSHIPTEFSFATLAKTYAGDVPVMALVAELERIGSIKYNDNQQLEIVNRSYTPDNDNIEQVAVIARAIADLTNTVEHNTSLQRDEDRWFQRSAFSNDLNAQDQKALLKFLQAEGQDFLEKVDNWMIDRVEQRPLTTDAAANQDETDPDQRAGVGVYFFQRD